MAAELLRRIDERMSELTLAAHSRGERRPTDRSISLAATGSPDTIRSIRRNVTSRNQAGISTETLRKLARALDTTSDWLITGKGAKNADYTANHHHIDSDAILEDPPPHPTVAVVGFVSAGSQAVMIPLPPGELDHVPAPPGASRHTTSLEIRGGSLGELFDRWLVYYDDVRSPVTPDLIGKLCVVGLADGRTMVKKIRLGRGGTYDLLSNTEEPIVGIAIQWAAAVKSMGPR